MEGSGFPFGGDPEDLMRSLREFAEQQAETVQEAQREQFATLTLNTAVELTAAALSQVNTQGGVDEQALALRDAMRVLFPERYIAGPTLADAVRVVRVLNAEGKAATIDVLGEEVATEEAASSIARS